VTTSGPIRVVLADEHAPTRAGVRDSLEGHGFEVCGEAAGAEEAVALARRESPDVCILDTRLPGGGIAAAARIHADRPEVSIVMLTASSSDEDLFDALRAGALGYLLKSTNPARLHHAVRGVLAGEAAIPRTLVARLVDEFRERGRRRRLAGRAELTSREWDVLERLAQGAATAEIAQRLSVSPVTVRRHVSAILRKLGVESREEAVRLLADRSGD
jgi:DNA-binding NarL/FixJ family response regulator